MTPTLRQAVRSLRRTPWYAATVIAVIALTTALSATVFAVVDGVLFKPLPYRDAHQLHTVSGLRANGRGGGALSLDEVRAMQRELPEVGISAFQWTHDAGTMGDNGVMYGAAAVDARFFDVLGQRPILGGFQDEHFTPGTAPVVIISNRLWRQRYGGSGDVIGRQLPVAGAVDNVRRPVARPTVVGVLPADFVFPTGELTDIIRPFALPSSESGDRNYSTASALVRIPNGMTTDEVTTRLTAAELHAQRPDISERSRYKGASVRTLEDLGITYRRSFRQLAAVTSTLILLAGVAIATLASGRARQQERQALIRRALGAGSWDLFRSAFFEASLLIGVASTVGVLLAPIVLAMVQALMPVQDYLVSAPAIDGRAVLLVTTLAFIVALVTAASSTARSNQLSLAAGSATGSTKRVRRFGRVLIGTQTALAFVLILGGTLGLASLWRAWTTDPGYEPDGLVLVEVSLRTPDFKQITPILGQLDAEFSTLPGVTSGMFGGRFLNGSWGVIGVRTLADGPAIDLQWVQAGGAFFEALGLTSLEGRLPTAEERSTGADVVVLSARAAQSLWPGDSALGKSVFLANASATVIGIVREPKFVGLVDRGRDAGQIYWSRGGRGETSFVLKTTGTTAAALDGARQIVAAQGATVDLIRAVTMHEALADTIKSLRLTAWLHGGFAFSALMIVATAVLGLVAMATSQRAREFGIRCALGARRDALIAMLLREQLVTIVCGLIAGGLGAYWFQGLLRSAAAGVTATDYRLWIVTAMTLLVTAMLGVLVPAIRSTRVDAAQTLRAE
jgi:predicted permease